MSWWRRNNPAGRIRRRMYSTLHLAEPFGGFFAKADTKSWHGATPLVLEDFKPSAPFHLLPSPSYSQPMYHDHGPQRRCQCMWPYRGSTPPDHLPSSCTREFDLAPCIAPCREWRSTSCIAASSALAHCVEIQPHPALSGLGMEIASSDRAGVLCLLILQACQARSQAGCCNCRPARDTRIQNPLES